MAFAARDGYASYPSFEEWNRPAPLPPLFIRPGSNSFKRVLRFFS